MGLQIRLTHSLGDRLIELPAQSADVPLVVGRAANAAVQVPSANIAKQHCLLFVADNRWVVQDGGSPTGTFLNGESVDEPAFLNSGDVITLGSSVNPPTILVDPHGLGVMEAPEEQAAPVAYAPPAAGLPQPMARGYAAAPVAPLPQPGAAASGYDDADDQVNLFGAAAAPAPVRQPAYGGYAPPAPQQGDGWENIPQETRYYVPKPQRTNSATAGIVIGVSCVVALGLGIWIYKAAMAKEEASKPKVIKVEKPAPNVGKGTSIFDERTFEKPKPKTPEKTGSSGSTGGTGWKPPAKTNNEMTTATAMPAVETEEKIDPRKQDEKWQAVEMARTNDPVVAIIAFNEYAASAPDSPFKKDLDQYQEEALDRIWWKRINELFQERDQHQHEIAAKKNDLAISQDPEFKKGLQAEITKLEEKRERAANRLKEQMKFEGTEAPDIYNDALLAKLRAQRDTELYAKWKDEVLRSIKSRRSLPWSYR